MTPLPFERCYDEHDNKRYDDDYWDDDERYGECPL
jgi:hypothetical protein